MVEPSLSVHTWSGVPDTIVAAGTRGFSSFNTVTLELNVAEQAEKLDTKVPHVL